MFVAKDKEGTVVARSEVNVVVSSGGDPMRVSFEVPEAAPGDEVSAAVESSRPFTS